MGWCRWYNKKVDGRTSIYCPKNTCGDERCYKCRWYSKKKPDANLPFKVREEWLCSICERCSHAYEGHGCGSSSLISEEYRRDCLYWSRKLHGRIEQCDTFDVAFRKAFEKMRSFNFYGPTVIAWEFAHYIMIALGWGLSEVEVEIRKKANQKGHPLYFPGSPPCADDHLQKIDVGSAYGRSGYITWRGSIMRRKKL